MTRHLRPTTRAGDQPSTDAYIGHADFTLFEREYRKFDPHHSYAIRDEWDRDERDFVAYWNLKLQKLLEELGHPSARPVQKINRWFDPIWRDGRDPRAGTALQWTEYQNAQAELWESLSQDERDAMQGMTDVQKKDREAFESMTPEQRAEHERAVRASGGGRRSTRNHVDGRILDERGRTVGRWDDNEDGIRQWAIAKGLDPDAEVEKRLGGASAVPPSLVDTVRGYYESNKDRADRGHGENWLRVLVAFGARQETGLKPYTAAEARESEKIWSGWKPVREALERLEAAGSPVAGGADAAPEQTSYKAEQDAYAEEVERFQEARDAGGPDAQQGFDEWRRLQSPNGALFPFNGTYVEDTRTGCFIAYDQVARRRDELTADNVRYRLSRHPDGMVQISWLALNYEGCLCLLPHNTETETRMVPAEEVPDLIWAGWRILTHKEYCKNQRVMGARDDKFTAFKLWAQHSPDDKPLGICPTQGDSSLDGGVWKHNAELFARLHGHAVEEIAPVDAPVGIANAIQAGDWAEVARLAQERI